MQRRFLFLFFALGFLSVRISGQQPGGMALDPLLENYEYPFPVKFIALSLQQGTYRMAYMDLRPAHWNGRTVVLFHGKNFSGAYWKQTAKSLQNEGFRVILPDQLGFGKSSKPEHFQYTFQILAQNTRNLLDTLQLKKVAVLGHSMGGMLAVRFTLMFPEMTEKLILENPIGLEDWKLKVPYQNVDSWFKIELSQNYDKIKNYQQENYYHGQWKPEYEQWVTIPAGWAKHPDYKIVAWNSALTYDMIFTQPVIYEFSQIKVPTLLVIGQRDRTALGKQQVPEEVKKTMGDYPRLGRVAKQAIKNSIIVELPNVGHVPHIEAFDQFIQPLLTFVRVWVWGVGCGA